MNCRLALAALAMLSAVPGGLSAQEADAGGQRRHGVDDLRWLAGCWEMSVPDFTAEEHWMSPRANLMLGLNRTMRSGRPLSYEFLIARESASGLVLVAHPSGQTPTEFDATKVTAGMVTFENPQHDFPKRIRYARRGSDSLAVRVDAGEGARGFDQLFRRVACH